MHCALSQKPLLFTLVKIGSSKKKIKNDFTSHCPSGPFPVSRCISTCILFCFSITIHKHTMINIYCGTQNNRLIEANHLSNEDTFKMIHCCLTLQQQRIDIFLKYHDTGLLCPSHE